MVKEECLYLLPERTPNISSPSVAKSQPSIAEKSDVQHENPAKDPETSFTGPAVLNPSSPLGQWGDSRNTPTVPEDPLSPSNSSLEQGDHSETKENLSNFQLRVRHALRVGRIKNMGRDPTMYGRVLGSSTNKCEATGSSYKKNDQPEQTSLFNLAYLFNVTDHSEAEAADGVEEAAAEVAI